MSVASGWDEAEARHYLENVALNKARIPGLTREERRAEMLEAQEEYGAPHGITRKEALRFLKKAERALEEARLARDASEGRFVAPPRPKLPPGVPEAFSAELAANPGLALNLARIRETKRAREMAAEIESLTNPLPPVDFGSLDEILARDESTVWRIDDLLPANGRLLLFAQRKAGKTTLVGNLTRSLLSGAPFLGRYQVKPIEGSVMILNYEVSGQMLAGWLNDMGFTAQQASRVQVVNLRGRENLLASERGRATLVEMMRSTGTAALIVDVFTRAFHGDQNSNSEVSDWLGALDRVTTDGGASELVLVAHAGWSGDHTRGASDMEGWPDVIVRLETDRSSDGDADPTKPRYFTAFGRDVDIDKARLDFDPQTRLLTYTGETRSAVRQSQKAGLLAEPIIAAIGKMAGITSGLLADEIRRSGIPHQARDVKAATDVLASEGKIVIRKEGRTTHHYLPDNLPDKYRDELLDPGGAQMKR